MEPALFVCRLVRPIENDLQPEPALTARQVEIATLVACGLGCGEIACRLGIAPRTVRRHLGHIHRRLGTVSQAQLVGLLIVRGLVSEAAVAAELEARVSRVLGADGGC